jgi:hypothetical protein
MDIDQTRTFFCKAIYSGNKDNSCFAGRSHRRSFVALILLQRSNRVQNTFPEYNTLNNKPQTFTQTNHLPNKHQVPTRSIPIIYQKEMTGTATTPATTAKLNTPTGGSSISFEADKWLKLVLPDAEQPGKLHGIVLIANWPSKEAFTAPYENFLPRLKSCFDAQDLEVIDEDEIPAAYFYPPGTLHITIATFIPFHEPMVPNKEEYTSACVDIMEKAFAREDWPRESFQVELDSVQIGSRAGIFLWKNEDGMVAKMRQIVQEEYNASFEKNSNVLNHRKLSVPGIIHSTFLRFGRVPMTDGMVVQERFKEAVKGLVESFGKMEVHCTRLVIERSPYMHIPFNDQHVLTSFES